MRRDLDIDDFIGLEIEAQRRERAKHFADQRVSRFEQEEEGSDVLGAARWFVVALLLVSICAGAGMWMAS